MNFYDLIQMLGQNIWIYGGSLIIILSVLIFVHEWGHYIVARMCGVKVEQFSIGFGKEIFGYTDSGGTRWKVSMIPLGGFVQLFGDTDPASAGHSDTVEEDDGKSREMTEAEKEVAFFTKPVWKRALVVVAGPAINYIFAIILLAGLYVFNGQPVSPPTAAAVIVGSSAEQYGFKPHDYIVSIDGKTINRFGDISREMSVALDQEKHFVLKRDGETIKISAKPKRVPMEDRFGFKSETGVLGLISAEKGILIDRIASVEGIEVEDKNEVIAMLKNHMDTTFKIGFKQGTDKETGEDKINELIINPLSSKNESLGNEDDLLKEVLYLSNMPKQQFKNHTTMTAVQTAVRESYVMTVSSLEALWQMVVGVRSATELGGIVRIGAIAGDMAVKGIVPFILLTALLSINLGFINLLPIPMLDGGHLMFYGIESVIGRPVPEQIQEYAFRAGFVFLIGVMAFANLNDIYQLIT